jgi:hypothetical protein
MDELDEFAGIPRFEPFGTPYAEYSSPSRHRRRKAVKSTPKPQILSALAAMALATGLTIVATSAPVTLASIAAGNRA